MSRIKDRRALDAGPNRNANDYATRLEQRLSAIEAPDYTLAAPTFSILPETGNVITVGVQLREADGSVVTGERFVEVYTSTDARGAVSAVNTSLTVSEGTQVRAVVTAGWVAVRTTSAGRLTVALSHSAAATYYLNVIWKDRLFASAPLVWT